MEHGNSQHVGNDNSCMGIHADSRGAIAHRNARVERGRDVPGEKDFGYEYSESGLASCCGRKLSFTAGVRKSA